MGDGVLGWRREDENRASPAPPLYTHMTVRSSTSLTLYHQPLVTKRGAAGVEAHVAMSYEVPLAPSHRTPAITLIVDGPPKIYPGASPDMSLRSCERERPRSPSILFRRRHRSRT